MILSTINLPSDIELSGKELEKIIKNELIAMGKNPETNVVVEIKGPFFDVATKETYHKVEIVEQK